MKPKLVIAVIDDDGNEALYVDGVQVPFEGGTLYANDIARAIGSTQTEAVTIRFQQVMVNPPASWKNYPAKFLLLKKYVQPSE